ncbi:MAG: ACT domain-containing protein [Nanoarchaeota archaeon]|nr:ACT domain-containing protein [Nanoarchaeota archaeon]
MIKDLKTLLNSMSPKLNKGEYVFCKADFDPSLMPVLVFEEEEGTTLILRKEIADKKMIEYDGAWSWITLTVHSDLEAVGFLAKITEKLAEAGISVNTVSAFHHDHLFVPVEKAEGAMKVLKGIEKTG